MTKIRVVGKVVATVIRVNGEKEFFIGSNVVVNAGKELISQRLGGVAVNPVTHVAAGSSIQVADETDTALIGTEHERIVGTITVTNNEFKIAATLGAGIGIPVTIGEFGIFNNAVAGAMLARFVVPEISFTVGDSIAIVWTIQFGD